MISATCLRKTSCQLRESTTNCYSKLQFGSSRTNTTSSPSKNKLRCSTRSATSWQNWDPLLKLMSLLSFLRRRLTTKSRLRLWLSKWFALTTKSFWVFSLRFTSLFTRDRRLGSMSTALQTGSRLTAHHMLSSSSRSWNPTSVTGWTSCSGSSTSVCPTETKTRKSAKNKFANLKLKLLTCAPTTRKCGWKK